VSACARREGAANVCGTTEALSSSHSSGSLPHSADILHASTCEWTRRTPICKPRAMSFAVASMQWQQPAQAQQTASQAPTTRWPVARRNKLSLRRSLELAHGKWNKTAPTRNKLSLRRSLELTHGKWNKTAHGKWKKTNSGPNRKALPTFCNRRWIYSSAVSEGASIACGGILLRGHDRAKRSCGMRNLHEAMQRVVATFAA
jgi:hypothetical protein